MRMLNMIEKEAVGIQRSAEDWIVEGIRGKGCFCKRAREPTLSRYTKRWITEQLIVQLLGSIYGVGP